MKNNTIPNFETDSLAFTAYLLCNSCSLLEVKSSNIPGKYLFVFASTPKIPQLEETFFSFKASVSPQSYYAAIRDTKRLLTEFRRKYEEVKL